MNMKKTCTQKLIHILLTMFLLTGMTMFWSPQLMAASASSHYKQYDKPIVDTFRAQFDGSLADSIVGRAIWYMEYGFIVYGHSKYATTGYCDCSQFVSMVYKDFGYSITSASRKYNQVGAAVPGVSLRGNTLVGIEKLKPGDIFTFWKKDSTGSKYIGHVAIYIGEINGKPCIIGTLKGDPTAIGILRGLSGWYASNFYGVRRVLPASAYKTGSKIQVRGPVIPAVYRMTKFTKVIMPKNLSVGF